jgi:cytochrome b561
MWGRDPPDGYSWTSIALHWLTAIAIFVLLFAGASIGGDNASGALQLHTSVGLTLYPLLWGMIVWRFVLGHPRAANSKQPWTHTAGVLVHFIILACLGLMLVTGPLMAWAGDRPLSVFGLFSVPAPFSPNAQVFRTLHQVHSASASIIAALVTLHILGVLKHVILDRDGVLDRIMVAAKPPKG